MRHIIKKRCAQRITAFYRNVSKKYKHTYSLELIKKNVNDAYDTMFQNENGLLRREPTIERRKDYYMANTDKWYYVYTFDGVDRILNVTIDLDVQRKLESKAEEQFKLICQGISFPADDYWNSMQLSVDMTDTFVEELYGTEVFRSLRCNDERCKKAQKNENAKAYWNEYLKRNEKGDEIVLTRHKKEVVNIIDEARMAMMKEFADRKYKVEINPTGNLSICIRSC